MAFTTKTIVSDLQYVLKFGKHKGETIEDVLISDPSYIIWMDDEKVMCFSDKIYQEAQRNDYDEDETYDNWNDGMEY